MPKKALWFVAIGLAGLLYVTWDAGRIPARLTLMNQSGAAADRIVVTTEHTIVDIGVLRDGESRVVSIEPAREVEITYRWRREEKRWRAINPVRAGETMQLAITPGGRMGVRVRPAN